MGTVTHNLNSQYVSVTVYNNSNLIIIPDDVTATSTTVSTIDLSSYGTLTGTWRAVVIDKGATAYFGAADDLNLAGQAAEDFAVYNGTSWVAQGGTELVKVIEISRVMTVATGQVAYTGVGFKSKHLTFNGVISGAVRSRSLGMTDGSSDYCIYHNDASTTDNETTALARLYTGVTTYQAASFVSFDADGFTIDWTKVGSPTGTAYVIVTALR
jgi:hypothetical protein